MEDFGFAGFGPGAGRLRMMQARRGDMRGVILNALKESPMHGYEVIRYLEEKTHGMWRPSPGSVYPTLQMLEEEELIESKEENGKKVYNLTKAGDDAAKQYEGQSPWERHGPNFEGKKEFRSLAGEIMRSFKVIVRSGDEELLDQAKEVLRDTRDKLSVLSKQAGSGE